ncbi:MAG: N-methyl-L-tryptophan oxidase [Chloroflexi bacterium]|nr:N-methyl-L-tryptophan oxidase [Chloroflexota bacterium]
MPDFDVVVVGLGAMGSAAAYQLARRGQRVLGLEAFAEGHTFGSSHGETRIIRMAYFEHPNYVPLLRRAYELWEETQQAARARLLHLTGGLFIGPPDEDLVRGSLESARQHNLPYELLDANEIRRRFPILQARGNEMALYEERAGVLFPEKCIDAHLRLAREIGAVMHHSEPATAWSSDADGVSVQTGQARYTAGKLVLTAGAWLSKLVHELAGVLQPERIPLFWFSPRANAEQFDLGRMPIWIWHDAALGDFFTTPHVEWPGVKIGKHHTLLNCDADSVDRAVSPRDEAPVRAFLERCVPDLAGSIADSRVCMYTNTPDQHFVIDVHPRYSNVVDAGGFSGHGFKFASVVGEILADLAMTGRATPHADFLRSPRLLSGPETAAAASR